MKKVKIIRIEQPDGNFGTLLIDGRIICLTLERLWMENKRDISCIPKGRYVCKRYKSNKYGETFKINKVTGRTGIIFHSGNVTDNTKGCILLGSTHGNLNGKQAILSSKRAMRVFMANLVGQDYFELDIL